MSILLLLSAAILTLDLYLPPGRAVIVLFVLVIILAGALSDRRFVVVSVVAGTAVTIIGYFLRHGWVFNPAYVARRLLCIVAIAVTGLLVIRNQAVQRRRRELAALLDLTGDAMFVRSVEGRIKWWNRQAETMYGWSSKQVLGRLVGEVLGESNAGQDSGAMDELTRSGTWQGELRDRLRNGREIDVLSRWTLRTDAAGQPAGILETNTDITDEKVAEAKLRQSEDRYRQIFENGGAAMLESDHAPLLGWYEALQTAGVTDLEGYFREHPGEVVKALKLIRLVDVNQTALTLLQAESKDHFQQFADTVFEGGGGSLFSANLAAKAAGRQFYSTELVVKTLRGESRTILVSTTLPSAQFPHLISCWIDVTEQRQTEARLRAIEDELALAARVATLGELTSSIAQDVDRPIGEIGRHARHGLAELRMPVPDMRAACDSIGQVVVEGQHAAEIISRVRDFLRRTSLAKVAVDLNEIVGAAVALTRHEVADRKVMLKVDLGPGLPPLDGDGPRLEHVVVNLILNAVESIRLAPSQDRLLLIETECQGGEVILRVTDNGRFCPSSGIARLFQPILTVRLDGTRGDIGLAVCRASVEAHRGRIWATPAETGGTIVHVALPAAKQASL